ncbi:hypothetical protein TNCV_2601481 [Trichonephila clavipes]|nr:hypothetical protein TNCV_2601481 [Trichonephila clavipes]
MTHKLQEFQQALGTVVLINTIRKEEHSLGLHGRVLITKSNHAARLRWCKCTSKLDYNRRKTGSLQL